MTPAEWNENRHVLTVFETIETEQGPMTALEARFRDRMDWTQKAVKWVAHEGHDLMSITPLEVNPDTWTAARAFHAESIAEANRQEPGCIYSCRTIVDEIQRQTIEAAYNPDKEARRVARCWLETATAVPHFKNARKLALRVTVPEQMCYRSAYRDVCSIRYVWKQIHAGSDEKKLALQPEEDYTQLFLVYPELRHVPAEWIEIILFEDLAGNAAAALIADLRGNDTEPETLRKRYDQLKEWDAEVFKRKGQKRAQERWEQFTKES